MGLCTVHVIPYPHSHYIYIFHYLLAKFLSQKYIDHTTYMIIYACHQIYIYIHIYIHIYIYIYIYTYICMYCISSHHHVGGYIQHNPHVFEHTTHDGNSSEQGVTCNILSGTAANLKPTAICNLSLASQQVQKHQWHFNTQVIHIYSFNENQPQGLLCNSRATSFTNIYAMWGFWSSIDLFWYGKSTPSSLVISNICGLFQGFYLQLRISGLQSLSLVIIHKEWVLHYRVLHHQVHDGYKMKKMLYKVYQKPVCGMLQDAHMGVIYLLL